MCERVRESRCPGSINALQLPFLVPYRQHYMGIPSQILDSTRYWQSQTHNFTTAKCDACAGTTTWASPATS